MRNAFAEEVVLLAEQDPGIILLSGDIGNRLFDPFKTKFSNHFCNCGVAKSNMTGVAADLAICDLRPVTYTVTP